MIRDSILSLLVAGSALACGSRGPLDLTDQTVDASAPTVDASSLADAGADGGEPSNTAREILECGLCITQKCGGKVQRCIADQACNRVLQCVAQKCLLSGLDLGCVTQCQDDPQGALKAFEIIQCITGVCAETCGGGLPLGGLGGFGGG